MALWYRTLHIAAEWIATKDGKMSVQELAASIAKKLDELKPFASEYDWLEYEKNDIMDDFVSLSNDVAATADDFDMILTDLYDWGDTLLTTRPHTKVCWIETFKTI